MSTRNQNHPPAGAVVSVGSAPATTLAPARSTGAEVPGDWRMARRLWPFLLASAVSLIPFTVFGMYLVPIAGTADGSVALLFALRIGGTVRG